MSYPIIIFDSVWKTSFSPHCLQWWMLFFFIKDRQVDALGFDGKLLDRQNLKRVVLLTLDVVKLNAFRGSWDGAW